MLFLIDTTAPFFIRHKKEFVNWSKAPYQELEKKGQVQKKVHKKIRQGFREFIGKVADIGYNAITVDELCYILTVESYPDYLKAKIHKYKKYYSKLFSIALERDLKIFLTTDVMFFHQSEKKKDRTLNQTIQTLQKELPVLFKEFPEISGIIFRIGESDGVDVKGDFKSEIVLKTPEHANHFMRMLLPVFEKHNRLMIFRTWTIGAFQIGDLIWNEKTYEHVFRGIKSEHLIVSMKYGETDFFRFQQLNPYFLKDEIPKIIELQARREYEGFGEFPNFPSLDYSTYRDLLLGQKVLAGIQVWSQTGGWSRFKNYTFLKKTSLWNELNTFVTLRLFRYNESILVALKHFIKYKKLDISPEDFYEFLRIADDAVRNILYDPVYGQRNLYMNRTRVPSLIHVTWDQITITDGISSLYRSFGSGEDKILNESRLALERIKRMREIAKKGSIDYSFKYHFDTFYLFYLGRLAMVQSDRRETLLKLKKRIQKYTKHYPNSYYIRLSLQDKTTGMALTDFIIRLAIREGQRYRRIERILFNPLMASVYMLIFKAYRNRFPDFLDKQAMSVRNFLK